MWCAYTYACTSVLIYIYIYIYMQCRAYVCIFRKRICSSARLFQVCEHLLWWPWCYLLPHGEGIALRRAWWWFFLRTETHFERLFFFRCRFVPSKFLVKNVLWSFCRKLCVACILNCDLIRPDEFLSRCVYVLYVRIEWRAMWTSIGRLGV